MSDLVSNSNTDDGDDFTIIELDARLEFGTLIIDSDLNADMNTYCVNGYACKDNNQSGCSNSSSCGS